MSDETQKNESLEPGMPADRAAQTAPDTGAGTEDHTDAPSTEGVQSAATETAPTTELPASRTEPRIQDAAETPQSVVPDPFPAGAQQGTPGAEEHRLSADRPRPAGPALPRKPRPRSGPIVWGTLVLAFCVYTGVRVAGGAVDARSWIITTVLGLGALLLGVGIAVLVRSGREQR